MNLEIIFWVVAITAIIVAIARHLEAKDFNGGICRYCGNKLRFFDTDSQGGRGYICDNCGHAPWCSYNVDKNYLKES